MQQMYKYTTIQKIQITANERYKDFLKSKKKLFNYSVQEILNTQFFWLISSKKKKYYVKNKINVNITTRLLTYIDGIFIKIKALGTKYDEDKDDYFYSMQIKLTDEGKELINILDKLINTELVLASEGSLEVEK